MESIFVIGMIIVVAAMIIDGKKAIKNSLDYKLYINRHKSYSYEKNNRIN